MSAKQPSPDVRNGDYCVVTGGTHAGKSGVVEDRKVSKTGHVTITVRLADDDRIKTLARNVVVQSAPKRKRPAP
ncbi:MAG: KOW motif-containing protein [Hyphomonadaceae bacterium]